VQGTILPYGVLVNPVNLVGWLVPSGARDLLVYRLKNVAWKIQKIRANPF
jgi:hypothetical protein